LADREEIRKLARESIARGDATGWFEELYRRAGGEWHRISWADLAPNGVSTEAFEEMSDRGSGVRFSMSR
jgi:hypothetical protein